MRRGSCGTLGPILRCSSRPGRGRRRAAPRSGWQQKPCFNNSTKTADELLLVGSWSAAVARSALGRHLRPVVKNSYAVPLYSLLKSRFAPPGGVLGLAPAVPVPTGGPTREKQRAATHPSPHCRRRALAFRGPAELGWNDSCRLLTLPMPDTQLCQPGPRPAQANSGSGQLLSNSTPLESFWRSVYVPAGTACWATSTGQLVQACRIM